VSKFSDILDFQYTREFIFPSPFLSVSFLVEVAAYGEDHKILQVEKKRVLNIEGY